MQGRLQHEECFVSTIDIRGQKCSVSQRQVNSRTRMNRKSMHLVVGKRDGTARCGHLMEAHVQPTLELM
jgi:hypothetical protein